MCNRIDEDGGLFDSHFSGGSICHLNVETQITDVNQMKELIKKIRAKSKNVHVGIIIGSPVFNQFPELVDDLGADMIGIDAADALEKATFYVERLR